MTSLLGWFILATLLCIPGLALLWPLFAAGRRRMADRRLLVGAYLAGTAASGLALWYLLPLAVWWFLGRPAH